MQHIEYLQQTLQDCFIMEKWNGKKNLRKKKKKMLSSMFEEVKIHIMNVIVS